VFFVFKKFKMCANIGVQFSCTGAQKCSKNYPHQNTQVIDHQSQQLAERKK
jgi:hypothetical protein